MSEIVCLDYEREREFSFIYRENFRDRSCSLFFLVENDLLLVVKNEGVFWQRDSPAFGILAEGFSGFGDFTGVILRFCGFYRRDSPVLRILAEVSSGFVGSRGGLLEGSSGFVRSAEGILRF